LLFGIGGAILGLILYSAFSILTGFIIGYVSLAVGYIVAKAMMMGSRGIGGRRYQIAAVILTYAAVSMSAIPIAISYGVKHKPPQRQIQTAENPDSQTSDPQSDEQQQQSPTAPRMSLGEALGRLALLGLASPFLELQSDGVSGVIGLIILIVGIRIAWRMAQGRGQTMVFGPFENSAPAR
jgi:hypothetical protein